MTIPSMKAMLEALIAAPSVSSVNPGWDQGNEGVIELLDQWTRALGFDTRVLEIPGHPHKLNLVASAGSGPDGLILSGHTDTVPYDAQRWGFDPFRLTESGGRLYGLGTSDMKSFFAIALEAVRDLDLARLRHPLVILGTADEESTMCGAQRLVDLQIRLGRHAVIGEPTGLRPVRMHKGIAMEAIRVHGRSGHSSDPSLGLNALEGMHRVIADILAWRTELQRRFRNEAFRVPVPTLNLGHIHGGDNPNRICGDCELQIDLRPLPGMALPALREELRVRLERLLSGSGMALELVPLFKGIEAMETPADAAIVQAGEELTGHEAVAVAFGTEGPYFAQLGLQTMILGAGDIDQAHQPDEFIDPARLAPMAEVIRGLVRRFCL
ncbi:MAG: acetylornithine deacetylase [Chromatiales bacterium]|jgi:acetylornithine deacetylase